MAVTTIRQVEIIKIYFFFITLISGKPREPSGVGGANKSSGAVPGLCFATSDGVDQRVIRNKVLKNK